MSTVADPLVVDQLLANILFGRFRIFVLGLSPQFGGVPRNVRD